MRRRFFADALAPGPDGREARLEGRQAQHLARVLRARPGQEFELAHQGRVYLGRVRRASPQRVDFEVIAELPAAAPAERLELGAALFKFDRFEWMLEKATELGLTRLVPLLTRRTDPRLAAAASARLERWRTIVFEAAQQSRRADAPELAEPRPLAAFLALPFAGRRIVLAEPSDDAAAPPLLAAPASPEPTLLLAGPEGGFAPEELAAALAAGFSPASLGPRILRAETAALAALARLTAG